jgi:glycosyltransferase involved in cell wall biosynthesis
MSDQPRIGFDLSPLVHPASPGVRRATREVWRALSALGGELCFEPLEPSPGSRPFAWRQLEVPRLVRRLGLVGFHGTVSAVPWFAPCVRVQTVHEVPWRPESRGPGAELGAEPAPRENTGLAHRVWARSRRARATLVPSEVTRNALVAERGGDERGIAVVPWGVGAPFVDVALHARGPAATTGAPVLVPGGTRPKKRLDRVLAVFAACTAARGRRLVVTGPHEGQAAWLAHCRARARALGVEERLELVGEVPDARLAERMRDAGAVVVMSDSEGFALPALEAAACGAPVVARAGSAAAEAAGSAACVHDDSTAGASAALARALALSDGERVRLAEAARARTWQRTAERVAALWCTLLP